MEISISCSEQDSCGAVQQETDGKVSTGPDSTEIPNTVVEPENKDVADGKAMVQDEQTRKHDLDRDVKDESAEQIKLEDKEGIAEEDDKEELDLPDKGEEDDGPPAAKRRCLAKRRKVALLLGYCGKGYMGMQKSVRVLSLAYAYMYTMLNS